DVRITPLDAFAKAAQATAVGVPLPLRRRNEALPAEVVDRRPQVVAARGEPVAVPLRRIPESLDAPRHGGPLRPPFLVVADVILQPLADLVDLAQGGRAPRLHLDAEHHALRPHVVAAKILEPMAHGPLLERARISTGGRFYPVSPTV